MVSRLATAITGLLVSLLISLVVWEMFGFPFLFLFVPIVPFLFRRGSTTAPTPRQCPECGFTTRDPEFSYCPRDGTALR